MKKTIQYFICISLFSTLFYIKLPQTNYIFQACDSIESCEAEQSRIKDQKESLETKIAENEALESDLTAQIDATVEKILVTESSIESLEGLIKIMDDRIQELAEEITEIEDEVIERFAIQQKAGDDSTYLQLLISSSSLTTLFNRMRVLEQFNVADQESVAKLDAARLEASEKKEKNELNKLDAENEKEYLLDLQVEQKAQLADLQDVIAKTHSDYSALKTSEADVARQKAILEGGVPSSNGWYLPAQRGWLTCGVGCYTGHHAVDFGMSVGTPLYAAAAGKVVYIETGFTGFVEGSFGNMVAITHMVDGVPYVSIYAHMTRVDVSPGDIVIGGEQIGISGETGEAYGPHLHLEILKDIDTFYYDKSIRTAHHINPLNVLPNPGGWQWSY